MTIDFEAEYVHKRKGIRVIVGQPAWWNFPNRTSTTEEVVHVQRLGLGSGRDGWNMTASAFEREYERVDVALATKRTWFRCVICGKLTTGRVPRASSGEVGDGSFRYPRRHKFKGEPCPGNIEEAEWVDVVSL